jgi:hypothetical protein
MVAYGYFVPIPSMWIHQQLEFVVEKNSYTNLINSATNFGCYKLLKKGQCQNVNKVFRVTELNFYPFGPSFFLASCIPDET